MLVQIKRSRGIEDLVSKYAPQTVEERRIEVVGEIDHAELLNKFKEALNTDEHWITYCYGARFSDVLKPEQINIFLQEAAQFERHEDYNKRVGLLVSRLIRNSYNAGCNNFYLDTKNLLKLNGLARDINAEKDRRCYIKIEGDVGDKCGSRLNYCSVIINGNAEDGLGYEARNSSFTVYGSIGGLWGYFAENSEFKTSDEETFNRMLEQHKNEVFYRFSRFEKLPNNKLIFIPPNGKEEVKFNNA